MTSDGYTPVPPDVDSNSLKENQSEGQAKVEARKAKHTARHALKANQSKQPSAVSSGFLEFGFVGPTGLQMQPTAALDTLAHTDIVPVGTAGLLNQPVPHAARASSASVAAWAEPEHDVAQPHTWGQNGSSLVGADVAVPDPMQGPAAAANQQGMPSAQHKMHLAEQLARQQNSSAFADQATFDSADTPEQQFAEPLSQELQHQELPEPRFADPHLAVETQAPFLGNASAALNMRPNFVPGGQTFSVGNATALQDTYSRQCSSRQRPSTGSANNKPALQGICQIQHSGGRPGNAAFSRQDASAAAQDTVPLSSLASRPEHQRASGTADAAALRQGALQGTSVQPQYSCWPERHSSFDTEQIPAANMGSDSGQGWAGSQKAGWWSMSDSVMAAAAVEAAKLHEWKAELLGEVRTLRGSIEAAAQAQHRYAT